MKALITLWKFSRPHTIIGSVISISTLYVMACSETGRLEFLNHFPLLIAAIITGICCNIYIVGINQIEDIELDKINKPFLPIASGELSLKSASLIIHTCMSISILIALYLSPLLLFIVSFSMFVGWAYSRPPFYLRKHHLPAALAIASVRGVMVNLGGYLVFRKLISGHYSFSTDIMVLSIFIIAFTIVIAWFKDLPDMKGDAEFNIRTLTLMYSPQFTVIAGNIMIISAYVFSIFYIGNLSGFEHLAKKGILVYGHLILMFTFIANTIYTRKNSQIGLKKYYKRFWLFFFAEYILYLSAYLIPNLS